jgi:hypothetical protein
MRLRHSARYHLLRLLASARVRVPHLPHPRRLPVSALQPSPLLHITRIQPVSAEPASLRSCTTAYVPLTPSRCTASPPPRHCRTRGPRSCCVIPASAHAFPRCSRPPTAWVACAPTFLCSSANAHILLLRRVPAPSYSQSRQLLAHLLPRPSLLFAPAPARLAHTPGARTLHLRAQAEPPPPGVARLRPAAATARTPSPPQRPALPPAAPTAAHAARLRWLAPAQARRSPGPLVLPRAAPAPASARQPPRRPAAGRPSRTRSRAPALSRAASRAAPRMGPPALAPAAAWAGLRLGRASICRPFRLELNRV